MPPGSNKPAPFVVKGLRRNGRVTFLCPTPEWALRKLNDFARTGYAEITATGPDGKLIDELELAELAKNGEPAMI